MSAQDLNLKSKPSLSWAPLYRTISWILMPSKLNYFADTFNIRLWEKIFMYGTFTLQFLMSVICMIQVNLPNNKYDAAERASNFIIFFGFGSALMKAITLIYYHAQLKVLNETIKRETSRIDMEPWEHKLAKKYFGYSKFIVITLMALYFNAGFSFILFELFSEKEYSMPIFMEFPGTGYLSPALGHAINYWIGVWGCIYAATVEAGFDLPAFLESSFVGYQLERCAHYCQMIGDLTTLYDTHEKQKTLLINCIRLHADIFDFIDEMAIINNTVVAVTVTTGVPLLTTAFYGLLVKPEAAFCKATCSNVFACTKKFAYGNVLKTSCMLIAGTFHLFIYCLLGEIVAVKCKEASTALYTSQWYNIEKIQDRRTFCFFLAVSQCEKSFSAGGFYNLSLETFTEFMKLAYAACAFMTKVM